MEELSCYVAIFLVARGIVQVMAVRKSKADIAEIAHALKIRKNSNQSMVLVLGSRAGGLYNNQSFYDLIKEYSKSNFNLLTPEQRFIECHKILQQGIFDENEIDTILTEALKKPPTVEASICLAELTKQGFFDVIISTNVDTVLEDAFKDIEMKERYDFEVLIPERDLFQDTIYSDRRFSCKIVKIFGDLPSRVYNVAKRDFYLDKVEDLKNYLGKVLARDIVVVGFDPIWDAGILRAFPIRKSPLWLVSEEEVSTKHPLASPEKYGKHIRYITGKIGNSEHFFKALHWHLQEGMPTNYQLVRETLSELRFMHNRLIQLGPIYSEVQIVRQEISDLKERMDRFFDKNGGDII